MTRITKCFKVNAKLWKEVKIHCATEELEISDFVEKQLKKGLKKK